MFIKLKENSPVPSCAIWLGNSLVKKPTLSNKVMKFTIVSGGTWEKKGISAYTADNRLIEPIKKDATGWTYDEEVEYFNSSEWGFYHSGTNLLTFEGFPKAVKFKSGANFFYDNNKCTDISTANIDTSECTNMNSMFYGCRSLTSLDLSNFDTSQVTDMGSMFAVCTGLTSLDVSNFNTSKVTDMGHMFEFCSKLASLDLSNWNMSKVTSTNSMFKYCSALKTITMKNCSQGTIDNIQAALKDEGILGNVQIIV